MITEIRKYFDNHKKAITHIAFWLIMLAYYISSNWPFESNKFFLFERMLPKVIVQILQTYSIIYLLVPAFLNKKKRILFVIGCLVIIYLTYVSYTAVRCFYLLPKYPEIYSYRPPLVFSERISNIFAFLNNITVLILPTILLMVFEYYRHQKEMLELKEQKKSIELEALKNQLNPHFLFNTLNNLYTLALKKSDDTPDVIAKLSEILDYLLFRCNKTFVSIGDEVKLLENYFSLEKLRYGKRLIYTFKYDLEKETKIAPLLMLTLLENAFKHGVSPEINKAYIDVELKAKPGNILFKISNSKPHKNDKENNRMSIGLPNIKKQLKIIYPNTHELMIDNQENSFSVALKLKSNEV